MGYKHGLEKKKFDAEWNKNERIYHELGMSNEQIGENESDKFWECVYNNPRYRGVEDIHIVFTDITVNSL